MDFAFNYLDKHLGKEQYYPSDAESIPENRLFAQFHSPQTNAMKNQILTELSASQSKLRVVFATVALGMGVDIPCIRHVIHVGPPHTVRECFQETGRAGHDGKQSVAVLYYNNRDIELVVQESVTVFVSIASFRTPVSECFYYAVLTFMTM